MHFWFIYVSYTMRYAGVSGVIVMNTMGNAGVTTKSRILYILPTSDPSKWGDKEAESGGLRRFLRAQFFIVFSLPGFELGLLDLLLDLWKSCTSATLR